KAMAKLPDNRYQTAAEMHDDLERFRNGQPVMATPLLDPAATTQAIPRGNGGADPTAMLGGPVAADAYTDYAEPEEERRTSVGWIVVSLLALVLVGLAAFFITRALTASDLTTATTLPPTTVPTTQAPTTTQPTTTERQTTTTERQTTTTERQTTTTEEETTTTIEESTTSEPTTQST
ncbi:MAG TPA: hypothetical protein VFX88_09420, partial [Actinomycetota bacterium]|nr:hypothetical protein [Actinomycetota bacterium]